MRVAVLGAGFANAGEISPGYVRMAMHSAESHSWLLAKHGPLIIRPRLDTAMARWRLAIAQFTTALAARAAAMGCEFRYGVTITSIAGGDRALIDASTIARSAKYLQHHKYGAATGEKSTQLRTQPSTKNYARHQRRASQY